MQLPALLLIAAASAAAAVPIRQARPAALLGHETRSLRAGTSTARSKTKRNSLADTSDTLASILDTVAQTWSLADTVMQNMETVCQAQASDLAVRAQSQSSSAATLQQTRVSELTTNGALQADLDHYRTQEEKAQESYDSTVAQRGQSASTYARTLASSSIQKSAVNDVLTKLREKASLMNDMGNTSNASGYSGYGGYQGTGMQQIIGIFSSMLDTVDNGITEETESYTQQDAELLTLVNSQKETLQLLDSQYEEKNRMATGAASRAQVAGDEAAVRESVAAQEEEIKAYLRTLCGTSGSSGGQVNSALSAGAATLAGLRRQVEQTLSTMDQIDAIQATSTTTTTTTAAVVTTQAVTTTQAAAVLQLHAAPKLQAVSVHVAALVNKTAANADLKPWPRWRQRPGSREPKALAWKPPSLHMPRALPHLAAAAAAPWPRMPVAAALPHLPGAPSLPSFQPAAPAPRSQQLREEIAEEEAGDRLKVLANSLAAGAQLPKEMRAVFARVLGTVSTSTRRATPSNETLNTYASETESCVNQKTNLTAQIISARREARTHRTVAMASAARLGAIQTELTILSDAKTTMQDSQTAVIDSWQLLTNMVTSGEYANSMDGALSALTTVEENVTAYINAGAIPMASGLPVALQGIRTSITSLQETSGGDLTTLSGLQSTIQVKYSDAINAFATRETALQEEETTVQEAGNTANSTVTDQEGIETRLMGERATAEAQCEQRMTAESINATIHSFL